MKILIFYIVVFIICSGMCWSGIVDKSFAGIGIAVIFGLIAVGTLLLIIETLYRRIHDHYWTDVI